jgi:tetratricopeptide (TPR) repeat protein
MHRPFLSCVLSLSVFLAPHLLAQNPSSSEQVQVVEAPMRRAAPPSANASFEKLVNRGDELRTEKAYLDALDYYRAALAKKPDDASVHNRMGIVEMQLEHWKGSEKEFERAIKADRTFSDAYNNLGVDYYELKKYGKAIKQYEAAIRLRGDSASYYSNLGAAYFSKKDFEKAAVAYSHALQIDPEIFEHNSRMGVAARLPSPEDRAHYDYVMAKLYAKAGVTDRALEHLRRAMEEGYKGIGDVYKDSEFAGMRKDPRFTQLMADRPLAIPE